MESWSKLFLPGKRGGEPADLTANGKDIQFTKKMAPVEFTVYCLFWILFYSHMPMRWIIFEMIISGVGGAIIMVFFHIQHSFQGVYKADGDKNEWDHFTNGMMGSSYQILPNWLKWFTLGVENHHIHHLAYKIPCYRLNKAHRSIERVHPSVWKHVTKLTMMDFFRELPCHLWDQENERFVSVYDVLFEQHEHHSITKNSETEKENLQANGTLIKYIDDKETYQLQQQEQELHPEVALSTAMKHNAKFSQEFRQMVRKLLLPWARPKFWPALYNLLTTSIVTMFLIYAVEISNAMLHPVTVEENRSFLPICIYWVTMGLFVMLISFVRARWFVVWHDFMHRSYFESSVANDVLGFILSITIVNHPTSLWKRSHALHHKYAGDTTYRKTESTTKFTLVEFLRWKNYQKWLYAVFFGHFSLFTIYPFVYFKLEAWSKLLFIGAKKKSIYSVNSQNRWFSEKRCYLELAIYCGFWAVFYSVVPMRWVVIELLTIGFSGCIVTFFVHVQHSYQGAYKADGKKGEYDAFAMGMVGCAMQIVPWYIEWFTHGIEYHHIHHLGKKIPAYSLKNCHTYLERVSPNIFKTVKRQTFMECFKELPNSLYDEKTERYVSVYDVLLKE